MSVEQRTAQRPSQKALVVHSCVWGVLSLAAYTLLIVVAATGRGATVPHLVLLSILGAGGSVLVVGLGAGLPKIARSITVACLGLLLLVNVQFLQGASPLDYAATLYHTDFGSKVAELPGLRYLLLSMMAVAVAGAVASRTYSRSLTTRLVTLIGALGGLAMATIVTIEVVVWLFQETGLGAMPKTAEMIILLSVMCLAAVLCFTAMLCTVLHGALPSRARGLRAFGVFGCQVAYYLLLAGAVAVFVIIMVRSRAGVWDYLLRAGLLVPELCALYLSVAGLADTVCQSLWMAGREPSPEGPMRARVVDDIPMARVRAPVRPAPVRPAPVRKAIEPAPHPEPPSVEERLKRLKGLHEKGLISDDEYKKRKEEVLKDV